MFTLYMFIVSLMLLYIMCGSVADRTPKVCVDVGDCVTYTECANAAAIVSKCIVNRDGARENTSDALCDKSLTKFRTSYCGISPLNNRTPMVCCSEFDKTVKVNTRNNFLDESDEKQPDVLNDTEKHKNVRLLSDECGAIDGNRIIGGNRACLHEYPWMALIAYRTARGIVLSCSGTIINSRYILTAAHCVKNQNLAWVRIGEYDQNSVYDCEYLGQGYDCEHHLQDIEVEEKIVHEKYRTYPEDMNDIALLRLEKPIDFSYKNAAPICLPLYNESKNLQLGGVTATVAGWGLTEYGYTSNILLKVNIPILQKEDCIRWLSGNLKRAETVLCAGKLGSDSCSGDSGGPLMMEGIYNETYRIIQYGIVSQGHVRCGSKTPAIYTDVTKYTDWILDNIRY